MNKAIRFISISVLLLIVAALMVPAVAAQDKPPGFSNFVTCMDNEATCYMEGSDTTGGAYITWHIPYVLDGELPDAPACNSIEWDSESSHLCRQAPIINYSNASLPAHLQSDSLDGIGITVGIKNADGVVPVLVKDSEWDMSQGTEMDNGNIVIAEGDGIGLYYLPDTDEYQVNYVPSVMEGDAPYVRTVIFQFSGPYMYYKQDSFYSN